MEIYNSVWLRERRGAAVRVPARVVVRKKDRIKIAVPSKRFGEETVWVKPEKVELIWPEKSDAPAEVQGARR